MATTAKGVMARPAAAAAPPAIGGRILWVALATALLFLTLSLASFDPEDPPSHLVAVHNADPRNLCGEVGALVAYHAQHVLGPGAWVLVGGIGLFLAAASVGRRPAHAPLRLMGLILLAVAVSAGQRLLLPSAGTMAGAPAGLLAEVTVVELAARFGTAGTLLLLVAAGALGVVVAADEMLVALARSGRRVGSGVHRGLGHLHALRIRPERSGRSAPARSGRRAPASGPIDERAGGVGATESFDPDSAIAVDEGDEDLEDEDLEDGDEEEYDEDEEEDLEEEAEDAAGTAPPRRQLSEEELREKIAKLPLRMSQGPRSLARDEDIPRQESFEGYRFPTLDLLEDPETGYSGKMESHIRQQAQRLEESLNTYGIGGEVVGIESGPVVTLYSVQLAPGTKVAKLSAISSDLARSLSAHNVRIVPNTAGKTTVGIEVPNLDSERVRLKELMSGGQAEGMRLPMFLGKDVSGEPLVADLTRMPHMLIAGTTGSGKSVCINTIIMSWLYTKRPNELKLVLVDPKMVELGQFADIPHLMCPVVTEMGRATAILEWAVTKMEERYELLKEASVRDVVGYNALSEEELYERFQPQSDEERARIPKRLPYIVFVIDELADLILTHKEVEQHIVRIAQKARAVGIHLIVATQRPQANVVTGLIKSNMPCRVSFKVASGMDSRIVLDQKGAELLLGQGDMLFLTPHTAAVRRCQGTLVTDQETRRVVKFLQTVAAPTFERTLLAIRPGGEEGDGEEDLGERDPLFDQAVEIIVESGRGSVSLVQRRLAVGYSRASRLVDQMARAGILGEHKGSVARDVLITMEEWKRMRALEEVAAEEAANLPAETGDPVD
jgi:S-DNA-T family DNA segregation ATPase FtsK/SpoIIIE